MSDLPQWLDYAFSEHAATAMLRNLSSPLNTSWNELIASAQAVMSVFQEKSEDVTWYYDEQNANPLVAAARILDSASRAIMIESVEERTNLALTAAVAYSMYGNFPSASAVLNPLFNLKLGRIDSSKAVLIATCDPNRLQDAFEYVHPDDNPEERKYLELLNRFLFTGQENLIENIENLFINSLLRAGTFIGSLMRSARVSLKHILELCVTRNLRTVESFEFNTAAFPRWYLSQLVRQKVRVLLPPQYLAIRRNRLLTRQENAIIALPTSTGKTFLGELCLMASLKDEPGIVCYIAPYVALGQQVYDSFRDHLLRYDESNLRVHRMLGGFYEDVELRPYLNKEVIVATPERFDAFIRLHPEQIPYIRCVVMDEAHLVESDSRGARLEGIVARLRMLQKRHADRKPRIIFLSAVLGSYERIQRWLDVPNGLVITSTWKPTARRIAMWRYDGKLTWHVGEDTIKRSTSTNRSKLGEIYLPWPSPDLYPTESFGTIRKLQPSVYKNVAYLVRFLYDHFQSPILIVCATKANTRGVARALRDYFPELDPVPETIGRALDSIERGYRYLRPLGELLKHQVAYHNSSLPLTIRILIENAVSRREVVAVAATTTLAEGVNLPFRFTILADWLYWGSSGRSPMSSLLFKNIAGRCGRAGVFTEGDTIIFDNPLGNMEYVQPQRRTSLQEAVFIDADTAEIESAFGQIYESSSSRHKEQLRAVLASQFLAAIPENPEEEDLVATFVDNLLSAHDDSSALRLRIHEELYEIRSSIVDESKGALARAASPLHLTNLGIAANHTGFSPQSCRNITFALLDEPEHINRNSFGAYLLRTLGTLPEQSNFDFRKSIEVAGSRFPVKPRDHEYLLEQWTSGEDIENIFINLPYVRRSKRSPSAMAWLNGAESDSWDQEFDKFTEFIRSVLEGYLPWLVRAAGLLSEHLDIPSVAQNWKHWYKLLELGVDTDWAIIALDSNAPASRKAVTIIGRRWPLSMQSAGDPLGIIALRHPINREIIDAIFREEINIQEDSMVRDDLITLHRWVFSKTAV